MDHRVQIARARKFLASHAGEDVPLVAVARAAGASMFHLARLYRAITGNTVGRALTRLRIERAAHRLVETPKRAITSIALEVGFRTPSSLDKAFRAALGMSPSQYRNATATVRRHALRKLEVEPSEKPAYRLSKLRVEQHDDMRVVFTRERGAYSQVSAPLSWAQLEVRIGSTPLVACQRIGASYGDPASEPDDQLTYESGVIVGPNVVAPPGTHLATWKGGTFAVFDYHGDYRFIADAFREIFASWAKTGFSVRRQPCLELYRTNPNETSLEDWFTELWIPIEEKARHA